MPDAPQSGQGTYVQELKHHTKEMRQEYQDMDIRGQDRWMDFITAFRPAAIKTWTRSETSSWEAFLESRGINLEKNRKKRKAQSIIDALCWKDFEPDP